MNNFCSNCGNELIDSAVFCSKCGTRIQGDLTNQTRSSKTNREEVYPFKKNWASAWVLIGSILSPFRELQLIFAGLGVVLANKEIEKYQSRQFSGLNTEEVDNYIIKQFIVIVIHFISAIVAFYFYLIEYGLAWWL